MGGKIFSPLFLSINLSGKTPYYMVLTANRLNKNVQIRLMHRSLKMVKSSYFNRIFARVDVFLILIR